MLVYFTAVFHGLVLSTFYVGSIYLFTLGRPNGDPKEIRMRMMGVSAACVASLVYTYAWYYLFTPQIVDDGHSGFLQLLGMGVHPLITPLAVVVALLLNAFLFLGPILHEMMLNHVLQLRPKFKPTTIDAAAAAAAAAAGFVRHGISAEVGFNRDINRTQMSNEELSQFWKHLQFDFQPVRSKLHWLWRNDLRTFAKNVPAFASGNTDKMPQVLLHGFKVLIFGPITEEIVFRSCMFYLMHFHSAQHSTPATTIWISSIIFGIAHCHHIVDHIIHSKLTIRDAILRVVGQFAYTTVFALYCGFVFGRTQQVMASIAMHAMCNFLGLPDFQDIIQYHADRKSVV